MVSTKFHFPCERGTAAPAFRPCL